MTARPILVRFMLLAVVLPGCASMTVEQYPAFYTPDLKTVAVVRFEGSSWRSRGGWDVADRLAKVLADNGTYRVIGPYEVRSKLASVGFVLPRWIDRDAVADALRRVGGVQAFIIGRMEAVEPSSPYDLHRWRTPCRRCRKWRRELRHKKKRLRFSSSRNYCTDCERRLEVRVAVRAEMVRVADGRVLHRTLGSVESRIQGRDCFDPPGELLDNATVEVVNTLVGHFAVVRKTISLSKKKAFRIARRTDNGELVSVDTFGPDEKELIVIVSLPDQADRNQFRVAVTRVGGEKELASESFIWSRLQSRRLIVFSPVKLAAVAGPGDYEAKFYSGSREVMKKKFRIESVHEEESK